MAESERLGASFNIDTTNLKAGLAQANRLIRESESEFKAAASGMEDWTKSEEGLQSKIKSLNDIADVQRKKVEALEKQYEEAGYASDDMSAAAIKLRTDINNQKAALNKTEAEAKKYEGALNDLEDGADDAAESMDDVGEAAKESGEGFTIAKGAIADLISSGLQALVGACKNAIGSIAGLADETRETRTALAKLDASFESAGLGAEAAEKSMNDLYGVLGDMDRATEASNLLAKMSKDQNDLDRNTRILTGVFAEFGDSIPTEGLAEGMQATAQMGEVQGVLADALEWQGINLDEYNDKLGLLGSAEERSTYIQQTLTRLYGESADAYRENNGALIEANEAQLEHEKTLSELGAKVEPITTKVSEGFNKILESVVALVDDVDFDAFGKKIDQAFEVLTETVIPAIIEGFGWVKDNGETIVAILAGIAAGFAAFKIANMIMGVVSAIKAAGGALALLNTTMLASPITWIAVGVAALVAGIILLIKNWDKVKEVAEKVWNKIAEIWGNVATWFSEKVIQPIVEFFRGLWESVSGFFVNLWNDIVSAYHTVIDPWIEIFTRIAAIVDEKIIQPVKNFFANLWEDIKKIFSKVSTWFNEHIVQPVLRVFNALWKPLTEGASKAWQGIKNVFGKVADFFGSIFKTAWEKVKAVFSVGGKIFDGIKEGIVTAFKTVVNAIIRGINKVVKLPFEGLNTILDTLTGLSIVGVKPFEWLTWRAPVPQIPELARGGILNRATTVVAGEDGAEAIVPLEKNTEWIDKVADKIASKQKQVIVNQTNNYAQAHTRYEIYKSKKQTAAAVRLALQGG